MSFKSLPLSYLSAIHTFPPTDPAVIVRSLLVARLGSRFFKSKDGFHFNLSMFDDDRRAVEHFADLVAYKSFLERRKLIFARTFYACVLFETFLHLRGQDAQSNDY